MEFKVTLKSGERGEEAITLSIRAKDELEATQWGQAQMKVWGWTQGAVIRVDLVTPVTEAPPQ